MIYLRLPRSAILTPIGGGALTIGGPALPGVLVILTLSAQELGTSGRQAAGATHRAS